MSNTITVVGTIATDPKRFTTQSGVAFCSFRLASGDRRYDRELSRWVDGETNWFGITAFRSLAENAVASFRKGERIIVTGRLRVRRWENGDRSGLSVEIEAEGVGHDLRWGVSRFERHGQAEAAEPGDAPARQPLEEAEEGAGQRAQGGWLSTPGADRAAGDDASGDEPRAEEAAGDDGFLPIAA